MNPITMQIVADKYIRMALEEDINSEDVSTNAVMPRYQLGTVDLICKQDGIIAGLDVFARAFQLLDEKTEIAFHAADGDAVKKGQLLATVTGDIRVLLSAERTALNYLQRMSGIATYTNAVAKLLAGTKTTLLDTRKTTPCMRVFEKYAVTVGGGSNHRYNLSDGVMLKDNHIGAAGGVKEAIAAAKAYAPFVRKIEVETETLDMVREAVEAGADIIMLDNMSPAEMAEAIRIIDGRAQTECSGNMTIENIKTITALGVDYVSSGALTHSAPILDISLKNLHAVESAGVIEKMTGTERRKKLLNLMRESKTPLSGGALGSATGVSRQVIVQDIALLRTEGHSILATARGYLLEEPADTIRLFKVFHDAAATEEELTTIVDLGGCVVDVMVNHRVYGKVSAPLQIKNRRDVQAFLKNLESGKSTPLLNVTSGYHFHHVSAESEEILDEIEDALRRKHFLTEVFPYEQEEIRK